jgi:hypothetical protein
MSEITTFKVSAADQRLQHAAAEEGGRYAISGVHFNERYAVATDGCMMAIRRKTSDIHHTNVVFDRPNQKTKKADAGSVTYNCVDTVMKSADGKNEAHTIEGRFPRWEDVVSFARHPSTEVKRIGLDAALLLRLAKAISEDGESTTVYIEFSGPKDPIAVTTRDRTAIGILMPAWCNTDDVKPSEVIDAIMSKPE